MKITRWNTLLLSLTITIANPVTLLIVNTIAIVPTASALTTKPPYKFRTPPNNGAPGTATAGASRGDCKVDRPILQAIAPIGEDKTVGGLTTSLHPEFWFSTNMNTDCANLEFVLQTDRGFTLYRAPVNMPQNSKPFAVQLPEKIALKIGKSYRWSLLAKQQNNPPIVIDGWVQRVEMDEPIGPPILKAMLYADQGIWHESASIVQSILKQNPNDPAAIALWDAIVSDAGLKDRTAPNPF